MGFPGGSEVKASACNAGRPGSDPWVGKIPWRSKLIEAECGMVVARSWGKRELGSCYSMGMEFQSNKIKKF